MTDLVERLRSPNALPLVRPTKLEREAADHIERLAHANKVQAEEIQEMRERLAVEQRKYESRVEQHEECVARLAAVERDVARMDWLDRNPQVILRSGKQHVRPLIDAAMRAAEFSAPAVLRKSVPSGWRDVLARARQSLGAAGGVGTSGAANAEMEFRIGGPLLDFVEDELEAADSADPVIHAQHDETGRMWTGPRSQLPRRYFECVTDEAYAAQVATSTVPVAPEAK